VTDGAVLVKPSCPFPFPIPSQDNIASCEEVAVGTKLYVGSLPYSTTEQQLSELFSQHGTVQSAKVITDRYTGQSRGFGFVEMATNEEAQKAITALNGSALGGRTLVVNEARPQEKRPYGSGGGGGGGGGEQRDRW
jgi:RNA recognition motif-containing protein